MKKYIVEVYMSEEIEIEAASEDEADDKAYEIACKNISDGTFRLEIEVFEDEE